MNRYLVVANQTLGGDQLLGRLRSLIGEGPAQVHVVVPATPPREQLTWTEGEANAIAQRRLDDAMRRFATLGAEVTGEVGVAKPVDAIGNVLLEREIDVIVLSTLPPGPSKWLKQDLPHRVERKFSKPVVHVVSGAERVAS